MLFTQLFEDDFNNKKKLNEGVNDDDCPLCKGTGEGLFDGESCPKCDGTGILPPQYSDDYDVDDDYDDTDYSDEESYYEKSLRSRGLGEVEESLNEFEMPVGQATGTGAQTDAPPNRSFGVMIKGSLPPVSGGASAQDIWETLELILPRDYPRVPYQQQYGGEPQRRVMDDLRNDGFAIVKQGINSEDIAATIASKFKKYRIPAEVIDGGLYEEYDPAQSSKFISAATQAAKIMFNFERGYNQAFRRELQNQHGFDPDTPGIEVSPHNATELIKWLNSKGCKLSFNKKEPIEFSLSMPGQNQPYTFNILDMIQGGELEEDVMAPMPEFYAGQEITWRPKFAKMIPIPATVVAVAPGKLKIKIQSPRMIQAYGKDVIVVNVADSDIMPKQGVAESDQGSYIQPGKWIKFGPFNKPEQHQVGRIMTVGPDGLTLKVVIDGGPQSGKMVDVFLGNKSLSFYPAQEPDQGLNRVRNEGVTEGEDIDVGVVVDKLQKIAAYANRQIQNADYDQQRRYATIVRDRAVKALEMIRDDGNTPEAAAAAFRYMQSGQQGMAEAKAATASFRAGNKKRAELNAMSDEERRAYDKEQQEKQRKRDDARLEKERQKLAAKKGVAEEVRLPYPVRSEKLGRANMELLIRAYNQPIGPRTTLSFGDRILELDRDDIEAVAHYYDNVLKDDTARWNFISGVMSDPDSLTSVLVKLGRRKPQVARQPGLFQEANKKKEDETEPEVKDVALQRAISRAKADFPTAGSGLEALAKDFMRGQEQDRKSFDQIQRTERQQDRMLAQINKIDQEQEQEIQDLEKQNSGLAQRLQQLQSVNSQLEKKLAAMSGRKSKSKDVDTMPVIGTTSSDANPVASAKPKASKSGKAKGKNPKNTQKPQAKIAQATAASTPSSMSSMTKQLTTQNPDVLEPVAGRVSAPRFNTAGAQDVVPRDVASNVKQNIDTIGNAMVGDKLQQVANDELGDQSDWTQQVANDDLPLFGKKQAAENKEQKLERPEADYGDEYQSMVKRLGQKAKEGSRKTVWDPVKKVYKTVPVNPVKEQESNRAGHNAIKSVSDWAEKLRVMRELQKDISLMADPEAKAAIQQRIGDLMKVGIQQGYVK